MHAFFANGTNRERGQLSYVDIRQYSTHKYSMSHAARKLAVGNFRDCLSAAMNHEGAKCER